MNQPIIILSLIAFGDHKTVLFDHEETLQKVGILPDSEILELVFRQANHVDETEWIANKSIRSLSVGDKVTICHNGANVTYSCQAFGWM
jgi:hypothetical protein